jgi:hypothetical protein
VLSVGHVSPQLHNIQIIYKEVKLDPGLISMQGAGPTLTVGCKQWEANINDMVQAG